MKRLMASIVAAALVAAPLTSASAQVQFQNKDFRLNVGNLFGMFGGHGRGHPPPYYGGRGYGNPPPYYGGRPVNARQMCLVTTYQHSRDPWGRPTKVPIRQDIRPCP